MKRLLFAMLCIVSALGMRAQGWTAQAPADGDFYLYNVGTGTYLSCGSEYWGTKACIDNGALNFTLASNGEGAYTLYTTSTFSYGNPNSAQLQSSGYVDQSVSATTWTFTAVEGMENTYTMLNAAGTYLVAPSDGTKSILLNAEAPTTNYGYWKLINKANLFPETASESNPADVTCLIGDASFESTNDAMENFWTITANNNNLKLANDKGLKPNNVVESWQSSNGFVLSQTITVPNGYYRLTAQTWCREYTVTGADLPYIYLNDVKKDFNLMGTETAALGTVAGYFSNGDNGNYYTTTTDVATVSAKSITLGAKGTRTNTWNVFDNFKLYYLGPIDLSTFVAELANAVAAAEATEGTIPTAAYNAIAAVVTANNKTYEDGDAYSAAITAINNAVSTYASAEIVAAYANYNSVKAAVLAVDNSIDVTEADNLANDGTDANLDDAIAAVRTALKNYLKTTDKTNVSLTAALLINPSFETGDFTGWTNNGMAVQTNTSFGKDGNVYCEKWQPNGTFGVSQTISSMPAGVYQLTAKAKARGVTSAKLSVAGIEKAITIADSEADYVVEFAVDDNTDITIAYEGVGTGAGSSWLVVDNFRLTLVSAGLPDVTAVEGKMNAEVAAAQTAAITAYNNEKTVANYNAAQAAIANAEASIAAYAAANAAIEKAYALKEAHNFASEAATTTFTTAITNIEGAYNDGTLTDADANAAGTTLGVVVTGWHGGNNNAAPVYLRDGFSLPETFAADPALHVNTWSTEGDSDGSGFSVPFYESWTADANSLPASTLTGTLTDLPNGLYEISAWVRVRAKNGVEAADATGITMDVNGGEAVDVTEGAVVAPFNHATYTAQGLVKQGELKLNFNIAAEANISWLSFQHVKYTKVRDLTPEEAFVAATEEDYAALNAAIEGKVLGFEAGEYAPYNNVEGVAAIAAAKAIDQTANNSQEDVQAATAAITNATWTANTAEVNAVYDGSFEADYSGQSGNINPTGWQRVKGAAADGYNVRLMNGTNAGLAATTSGKALFTKQSAYYGYANGYTMPLKANTMYKVTFVYGGWGDCKKDGYVSMAAPDGSAVTLSATDLPVDATNADADVNAWKSYEALFTTGEAGDYVLGLRKKSNDTSGQSQYVYGDIVIVKASADDIKDQLLAELNTANGIDTEANVGDAAFQIPATAATALTSEITDAQGVYDNAATATVADILQAIEDLKAAEEAYKNAELNAPAEGQLFNVVLTYDGWTYDNKAMTYIANGRTDAGNYNIQYKEVANQNLAQAFTFTKVEGNNYKMSQIDADGVARYISTGVPYSGNTAQIRTTTNADDALVVTVIPTTTEGKWNLRNTAANQYIGSQDAGVYTVNSHIDFQLVETQKPSIAINTTAAGWGTTMLPFAVASVPEGVKVYSCAEAEGATLTLTEVTALEANKPYIIEGAWEATLTGDAQGTQLQYTEGMLTGTYAKMAAPNGCYILQKQGEKVGFFKVDTSVAQPNVGANRAYIASEGGNVKAFYLGGDTDGINSLVNDLQKGDIYDLAGRKVQRMQKGNVYIVNGKKVVIK